MFYYQRNLLSQTDECTKEVFTQIVTSSDVIGTINSVRSICVDADGLERQGRADEARARREEASRLKRKLPGFLFQATFDESVSKNGRRGRWRKQSAARLTGLYVCDFDHVDNPRDVFEGWLREHPSSDASDPKGGLLSDLGICLVYVTPSGHGLKVVATADARRGNLIGNQRWLASQLGMQTDEACKDASRLSFACRLDDILFIHQQTLFDY